MLLSYSRLGAIMVGDLPGHAIASELKPLHDDIVAGPWPNRNLLLLPLASASTLVTQAAMSGVSERAIQEQSGHKSLLVLRRYIRDGSLFRENAAAKVGL